MRARVCMCVYVYVYVYVCVCVPLEGTLTKVLDDAWQEALREMLQLCPCQPVRGCDRCKYG